MTVRRASNKRKDASGMNSVVDRAAMQRCVSMSGETACVSHFPALYTNNHVRHWNKQMRCFLHKERKNLL